MRLRRLMTLLLGSFMLLPVGFVLAEEGGGPQGMSFWNHDRHGMQDLGITDDQKTKLKSVWESEHQALKALRRKGRDLTIKLYDQLEDKADDSDLTRTMDDLKANREALRTQSQKFNEQRDTIFSPTQRAQLILMHEHHGKDGKRDHQAMDSQNNTDEGYNHWDRQDEHHHGRDSVEK